MDRVSDPHTRQILEMYGADALRRQGHYGNRRPGRDPIRATGTPLARTRPGRVDCEVRVLAMRALAGVNGIVLGVAQFGRENDRIANRDTTSCWRPGSPNHILDVRRKSLWCSTGFAQPKSCSCDAWRTPS